MKDGYYWVRRRDSSLWKPLLVTELCVIFGYDAIPKEYFEIGDYIETPDKYKE